MTTARIDQSWRWRESRPTRFALSRHQYLTSNRIEWSLIDMSRVKVVCKSCPWTSNRTRENFDGKPCPKCGGDVGRLPSARTVEPRGVGYIGSIDQHRQPLTSRGNTR